METPRKRVLAVLGGLGRCLHPDHIAELASHLCENACGDLILAFPIVVPLSLPLDAEMPEQEAEAQEAVGKGLTTIQARGCDAQLRIVRHRHAADAILELARAEQATIIVLGIRRRSNVPIDYDPAKSAEAEIIRQAECEVIVDREAINS